MEPHENWLLKADHDLKSAEFLMTSNDPLYDIVVYHTQQCAEKSLKAFLAYNERELEKIHNLIVLTNMCSEVDIEFNTIKENAIFLNPYATLYRYPEGDIMPSKEMAYKAISVSKKIYKYVREKIKADI